MRPRIFVIAVMICCSLWGCLSNAASENGTTEYDGYVVQQGQTLANIADEYGIPVEYLAAFNKLKTNSQLSAGQVIMVPIISELVPEQAAYAQDNSIEAHSDNQVVGVIGKVSAERTEIRTQPTVGQVLFRNATKGTDLLIIGEANGCYAVLMSDGSTGWVPASAVSVTKDRITVDRPAAPVASSVSKGRQNLVDTALEYLGVPYRYGGRLPNNVDCSLLVQTVFERNNIRLPRTAAQQFRVGTRIAVNDLQPGDRLYFYNRVGGSTIGHTGLYIGNGRFVHASSNRGAVAIDELKTPSYWSKYAGARR